MRRPLPIIHQHLANSHPAQGTRSWHCSPWHPPAWVSDWLPPLRSFEPPPHPTSQPAGFQAGPAVGEELGLSERSILLGLQNLPREHETTVSQPRVVSLGLSEDHYPI